MKAKPTPWYWAHVSFPGLEWDHVAIGDKLRSRRKALDLSLREIARRMDVSAPHVSDLELGRRTWRVARIEAYEAALVSK